MINDYTHGTKVPVFPTDIVTDPRPAEGWGVICPDYGSQRAHFYRNGVPVCSQGRARYRREGWYYLGSLTPTRGKKTDCGNCKNVLSREAASNAGE